MEWKWSVFCFCLDRRSVLHLSPEAPLTPRQATAPDAPCRCPYAPPRLAPPPLTRPRTAWRGWAETCWRPSLRVRIRHRTVHKKKVNRTALHLFAAWRDRVRFSRRQVYRGIFGTICSLLLTRSQTRCRRW